jgi:hypothetical protein
MKHRLTSTIIKFTKYCLAKGIKNLKKIKINLPYFNRIAAKITEPAVGASTTGGKKNVITKT